jgi:hypothetical protein
MKGAKIEQLKLNLSDMQQQQGQIGSISKQTTLQLQKEVDGLKEGRQRDGERLQELDSFQEVALNAQRTQSAFALQLERAGERGSS